MYIHCQLYIKIRSLARDGVHFVKFSILVNTSSSLQIIDPIAHIRGVGIDRLIQFLCTDENSISLFWLRYFRHIPRDLRRVTKDINYLAVRPNKG